MDGDGHLEIVVYEQGASTTAYSAVYVVNGDGTIKLSILPVGATTGSTSPALADLNGDGKPEIILQTDSTVEAWTGDGNVVPGFPVSLGSGYWLGSNGPVVGDVDGDGKQDIVVVAPYLNQTKSGKVWVFNGNGVLNPHFPKTLNLGVGTVPAIGDIDRDGRNEIVVAGWSWTGATGTFDSVWAFDLGGGPSGKIDWGQFGGGPSHTGLYGGFVPPQPTPTRTSTPTVTSTLTRTSTPTMTSTPTLTPTSTRSPTLTVTPSSTPSPTPEMTFIPDVDINIQYNGWRGVADSKASGGSYRASKVANDSAAFSFSGTAVTWITLKGPDQGQARVLIDGVDRGVFDNYRASTLRYSVAYPFTGLANTSHTLTIQVLGAKNTSSTGVNIVVDGFMVGASPIEETASSVSYNTWIGRANSNADGGAFRNSTSAGAFARFSFSGARVQWMTIKGPSQGQARVFIDKVEQPRLTDLYSAKQQWQVPITFEGLSAGPHTVEIRPAGTKNAASTGLTVAVDGFKVLASGSGAAAPNARSSNDTWWAWLAPLAGLGAWLLGRRT